MSEKPYFEQTEAQRLRSWILTEMLSGAGKAAVVLVAIGVLLWAIWGLGQLLPPESKQAPSPQQGAIEQPLGPTRLA
jgi:hypothetical protein